MVLVFETCCVQRVPLPQWNSASKCKPTTTWSAQHKTRWSFTALEIKPKAVRLAARNTLRGWTVVYLKSHPSDFLREMFKNNVDFFFFFLNSRWMENLEIFSVCPQLAPTPGLLVLSTCVSGDSDHNELELCRILDDFILSGNAESLLISVYIFRFWNSACGRSDSRSHRMNSYKPLEQLL